MLSLVLLAGAPPQYERITVPLTAVGTIAGLRSDYTGVERKATRLPDGWEPVGAIAVPVMVSGDTMPAVVACRRVDILDPAAEAARFAAARADQAAAERAAGVGAPPSGEPPASSTFFARQRYEAIGRTAPADLSADARAVFARTQAGASMDEVRASARRGATTAPADAPLEIILTAGGLTLSK